MNENGWASGFWNHFTCVVHGIKVEKSKNNETMCEWGNAFEAAFEAFQNWVKRC